MDRPTTAGAPPQGLSQAEAAARLQADGANELGLSQRRSLADIVWEVVREPMFLLLLGAGAIYLATGDPQEALVLLGFVCIIIGVTIVQERRTDNALEALRDLSSPRAQVIRDGVAQRIAGREVVRGDVLVLTEGDRVAADARAARGPRTGQRRVDADRRVRAGRQAGRTTRFLPAPWWSAARAWRGSRQPAATANSVASASRWAQSIPSLPRCATKWRG